MLKPLPYPISAIVIALLCWALVVSPLALSRQLRLGDDLPILLGIVGIAVCSGLVRWVTLRYRRAIDPIHRILEDVSHPAFIAARTLTLKRMASTKWTAGVTLALWIVASIALTSAWLHGAKTGDVILFDFMPAEWYATDGIGWRLASVILMALPVAAIVWTGGRMLVIHTLFILSLRQMRFIASYVTCIRILRPALTIGVVTSIFWAFGTVLFIILLREKTSLDRLLFLSALSAIGTFGFVVPILGLRANFLLMREQRLDRLTQIIAEKVKRLDPDPELLEEINELEDRVKESSRPGQLFMGWRYVAWFLTVVLVPACISLLQYSFEKIFSFLSAK